MKFLVVILFVSIVYCDAVGRSLPKQRYGKLNGGTETKITKYPYIVSVRSPSFLGRRHFCTGIILSSEWILTAANCVKLDNPRAYHVRTNVTKHDDVNNAIDISVVEIYIHPNYINEKKKFEYDVALLKLDKPIEFSDHSKSIDFNTTLDKSIINDGTVGINIGWSEQTSILNKVVFKVINNENCQKKHILSITDNMLCLALKSAKLAYVCQGDAGSPFIVNKKLVGITVFGVGCEKINSPAIIIKLSSVIDWIRELTGL